MEEVGSQYPVPSTGTQEKEYHCWWLIAGSRKPQMIQGMIRARVRARYSR